MTGVAQHCVFMSSSYVIKGMKYMGHILEVLSLLENFFNKKEQSKEADRIIHSSPEDKTLSVDCLNPKHFHESNGM